MQGLYRFRGTLRHVRAHWPSYFAVYLFAIAGLLLVALSAGRSWSSILPLLMAVLLVLLYFTLASLWAAHQLFDPRGLQPHHALFEMAQIQESDTFAYINLAFRHRAIELAQRLTGGRAIVIDVYSPQWAASRALARRRRQMPNAVSDPRLDWRSGEINLLPLPDDSVSTAILCQVMGEFWQVGDRKVLLKEIYRILKANGRILVAERARTHTNWLVMGPRAFNLPSLDQWRRLLSEAGFHLRSERHMEGLIHCFRADKPTPTAGRQLPLFLE